MPLMKTKAPSSRTAIDSPVLRVLVIKTDNLDHYAAEIAKGQAMITAKGARATLRVWRARFAGPEAGSVIVTVEYPSLQAYVDTERTMNADAEYVAWYRALGKRRAVVSDSLFDGVEPGT